MSFIASQYLKLLSLRWVMIIKTVNSIFQMTMQTLQSHSWNFHLMCKMFIDIVSDSTLQLSLRNSYSWVLLYQKYPKLFRKAIKILFPLTTRYLYEAEFSSYGSTKTDCYRLNAKADIRVPLSCIMLDIKEVCKNVKWWLFVLHCISFWKIVF